MFYYVENHSMFSCREHWNGEHGLNMSFCTEVDWVMHGSITTINGKLPWVFLALKKHLSSSLEPSQPFYLAGISLELHLVATWPHKHTELAVKAPFKACLLEVCTT